MQLSVYKASAGSGKTYTLTKEYLRIALLYPNNTKQFAHILAVTFTNKATEEMKKRILSTLNDLANGNDKGLATELCADLRITPTELQERALRVRTAVLHNYSHFSISTIDKFFQKIINAFMREAGLRPGFNVELDSERLLEEAVEALTDSMGEDEQLRKWVLDLVDDSITDSKAWDIRPRLMELGQEVFKESFRRLDDEFHQQLSNKEFLNKYSNKIKQIVTEFEQTTSQYSKQAFAILNGSQLTIDDFKFGKNSFANYFKKIGSPNKTEDYEPSARVSDALNNIENWYTKTSPKRSNIELAYTSLNPLLQEVINYINTRLTYYTTAKVILRNLGLLGVLADISRNISRIAAEENLIHISESSHLLNQLIGNEEAPFVYEKTGSRYTSYMLDEFQDTSEIQWQNFRPLLTNSLSENQPSMVVGDVKQSIYRWRNGNWKILAEQLGYDFKQFGINEHNLDTNWRSSTAVVEFNNNLFDKISHSLQQKLNDELNESSSLAEADKEYLQTLLLQAYNNAEQKVAPKNKDKDPGYVCMEFVPETEEQSAKEIVLERLPLLITDLQDRGYQAGDIAILVRSGVDGQAVADTLLTYKQTSGDTQHCFDVISQDSLFLSHSPVVQLIIGLFSLAIEPNDRITSGFLRYELLKHNTALHSIFSNNFDEAEQQFIESLSRLSLAEAYESIIQHYQLNERKQELPFLQELHDIIQSFSNRKLSDISLFLDWWEVNGSRKTLSGMSQQNAITLLTIHKSKGLQFKVVIVPFCNWSLTPKNDSILWMQPQEEPFNQLSYLPIPYSSKLLKTIFAPGYLYEKAQSYVDNLNLLYVALTRAENELFSFVPVSKRQSKDSISNLLQDFFTTIPHQESCFTFGGITGNLTDTGKFEFGHQTRSAKQPTGNTNSIPLTDYVSSNFQPKLRLKYQSSDFFSTDGEQKQTKRNYGIFMHRVFAEIRTVAEIAPSVQKLYEDGLITKEEIQPLLQTIQQALKQPEAADWFSGNWELRNEAEILLPADITRQGGFTKRPDRVMTKESQTVVVDYKFGDIEDNRYKKQLSRYIETLQAMGYPNVSGYLWYINLNKVVSV